MEKYNELIEKIKTLTEELYTTGKKASKKYPFSIEMNLLYKTAINCHKMINAILENFYVK